MVHYPRSSLYRLSLRLVSILSLRFLHSYVGFKHFSLPFQGTFHLSFTLLLRYRSSVVFRLTSRNLASSRGNTKSRYSGTPSKSFRIYGYGTITLYGSIFQEYSPSSAKLDDGTTHHISAAFSTADSVWPFPFSLAAINGIAKLLSFPRVIRMFWLARFPFP